MEHGGPGVQRVQEVGTEYGNTLFDAHVLKLFYQNKEICLVYKTHLILQQEMDIQTLMPNLTYKNVPLIV